MKHAAFRALLADLFVAAGAVDGEALPGAGRLRFRGCDVALYHDERLDPWNIHVYIDLGAVPRARQREVFRALLMHKLQVAPPHRSVVGLDPEADRIVQVTRIACDAVLDGERLAAILRQLVGQADAWRSPKAAVRPPSGWRRTWPRPS